MNLMNPKDRAWMTESIIAFLTKIGNNKGSFFEGKINLWKSCSDVISQSHTQKMPMTFHRLRIELGRARLLPVTPIMLENREA